jgi:P27 family predicted phage terminase small subunit
MAGRKPKPTKLKILEGNPGKQRLPKGEPMPDTEMPEAPEHLDKYAREEWDRLAPGLHALGILYEVDRGPFAAYCKAYSLWRRAEESLAKKSESNPDLGMVQVTKSGNIIQHTLLGVANKAAADMVRYAAEFGLTPSARARLAIDPGRGKKSKFEGLIGGKTKK